MSRGNLPSGLPDRWSVPPPVRPSSAAVCGSGKCSFSPTLASAAEGSIKAVCDDVNYVALALDAALTARHSKAEDCATIFLEELRPHNEDRARPDSNGHANQMFEIVLECVCEFLRVRPQQRPELFRDV